MLNYLFNFLRGCTLNYVPKPEESICIYLAAYLKEMTLTGKCRHVWFHVSNEGSSKGKQLWGARQRNMGKFAGVADYVFLGNPSFALEIKNGKKPLQESQEIFKRWCGDCLVTYAVAGSYQEAVNILIENKIIITKPWWEQIERITKKITSPGAQMVEQDINYKLQLLSNT